MGSASRKGLRRNGLWSGYVVEGPRGTMMIDRQAYPRRIFVRAASVPRISGGFFAMEFKRLGDARAYAEVEVGTMPYFLRRAG